MKAGQEEHKAKENELLLSFLRASSDFEADHILASLIHEVVEPITKAIIRTKLRLAPGFDDPAEDLRSDIVLRLLKRLRNWRSAPRKEALRSFTDYVAVVAHNSCNEHLRQLYPGPRQPKYHLRYVLTHHEDFAIWLDEKSWLCGYSGWNGRRQTGTTLEIDQREFLRGVWAEIEDLPLKQRRALLLGCRDEDGEGILCIFPQTGIANMTHLSEALQVSAAQLAEWWNELPLDDRKIGQLLSVTRQQVINLRKSARKRLTRRLKSA